MAKLRLIFIISLVILAVVLMATLLNEMDRQDLTIGMITMCAAYGQSGTMIVERLPR